MRKNIKKICVAVMTTLSMLLPGMQVHAAEPPAPMFTVEQKKELYRLWDEVLDSIKEDGSLDFRVTDPDVVKKVSTRNLIKFSSAVNLGPALAGHEYHVYDGPDTFRIMTVMPQNLKQQNQEMKEHIRQKTAGKEPTLETAKALFEEMAMTYTYQSQEYGPRFGCADMLMSKTGNCANFSVYYKALMDALGIENYMVVGNLKESEKARAAGNTSHMWNVIVIDGVHYAIDISRACEYQKYGYGIWDSFRAKDSYMVEDIFDILYIV